MSTTPTIGILGLGYVGLPLAVTFAEAGVPVLGLDAIQAKVDRIKGGDSYIEDIHDRLRRPGGKGVGLASVYRALDVLAAEPAAFPG